MVRWPQVHFAFHLIDILLCIINHLNSLLPFFLKSRLSPLNVLLLHLHPAIDLLLLCLKCPWRELVLLEQLFYMFSLFLLFELEDLLSEFDQFGLLGVLHDDLQLFLGVLLECISVKERITTLTCNIVESIGVTIHGIGVPLHTARFNTRLSMAELKLTVRDSMR